MIFALLDFLQYRSRTRRYGDDPKQNFLALGHLGKIPQNTIDLLEPGDVLLTQKLDSLFSWGTMYFGTSPVDHLAIYIGDNKVIHATLSGVKEHSLLVFGNNTRVLPARLNLNDLPRSENKGESLPREETEKEGSRRLYHFLPPKYQLLWVAGRILLGLEPDLFRWKFYLDLCLLAALMDSILIVTTGYVFFLAACILWALPLIANLMIYRYRIRHNLPVDPTSHPDLFLRVLGREGGTVFPSQAATSQESLRIIPLSRISAVRQPTEPQ